MILLQQQTCTQISNVHNIIFPLFFQVLPVTVVILRFHAVPVFCHASKQQNFLLGINKAFIFCRNKYFHMTACPLCNVTGQFFIPFSPASLSPLLILNVQPELVMKVLMQTGHCQSRLRQQQQ